LSVSENSLAVSFGQNSNRFRPRPIKLARRAAFPPDSPPPTSRRRPFWTGQFQVFLIRQKQIARLISFN